MLTGNFAKPGAQYSPTAIVALARGDGGGATARRARGPVPVAGARIISGLVPCNVIAEEILTDHPARYRAMLVESGNPAHSLADSPRMREALAALELVVVIDVAMTETARLADYVLPAPSQFEKWEATFFNFEFPDNVFHLRQPVLAAPDGTLPEPEIHARLVEALGALDRRRPRAAARRGRGGPGRVRRRLLRGHRRQARRSVRWRPIVLYRTLGPTLPDGAAAAAILWGAAHRCALSFPEASVRRAGFDGEGLELGEAAVRRDPRPARRACTFTIDE